VVGFRRQAQINHVTLLYQLEPFGFELNVRDIAAPNLGIRRPSLPRRLVTPPALIAALAAAIR